MFIIVTLKQKTMQPFVHLNPEHAASVHAAQATEAAQFRQIHERDILHTQTRGVTDWRSRFSRPGVTTQPRFSTTQYQQPQSRALHGIIEQIRLSQGVNSYAAGGLGNTQRSAPQTSPYRRRRTTFNGRP